jgi:hypothetical protein
MEKEAEKIDQISAPDEEYDEEKRGWLGLTDRQTQRIGWGKLNKTLKTSKSIMNRCCPEVKRFSEEKIE